MDTLTASAVRPAAISPEAGAATFIEVAVALAEEFPEVPRDVVDRCVAKEVARLREARILVFLGVLVHRAARDRLRLRWGKLEATGDQ